MSDFNRVRAMYGNATAWSGSDHADRPDLLALRESALAEFDEVMAQHDAEVQAAALDEAAARIESKRTLLGIASRALDIGQAWSAALLRDDAKRLRSGGGS